MSVSSPLMQQHEVQSSTATTRLPGRSDTPDDEQLDRWVWENPEPAPSSRTVSVDDDQSLQSICKDLEPSALLPAGSSCLADYVLMAAVCAIVVFLWMQ